MHQAEFNESVGLQALGERLRALALSADTCASSIDGEVMAALMDFGRRVMGVIFHEMSRSERFVEDGKTWVRVVESMLDIITRFGHVHVERPLYRDRRNGPTRCLVTERAGLINGLWTQDAARIAAELSASLSMNQVEGLLHKLGVVGASRSSVLRLVNAVSEAWEGAREQHEDALRQKVEIPEQAKTVMVSLDGVMLKTRSSDTAEKKAQAQAVGRIDKGPAGYQEASVGVIAFFDHAGTRVETRRYARMPEEDKKTTKDWLRAELGHVRAMRPDIVTIAIADGSANNWPFLESLDPDHQLVDFYHTAEHLHRHVSAANGAGTIDTQAKLKDMRRRLLEVPRAAEQVFAEMAALREAAGTAPPSKKASGKGQPTFWDRHHGRMDYVTATALNLPIGSGVTESTCRWIVGDRLRGTGMRWSPAGGQAVMTLRAWVTSSVFDTAWSIVTGPLTQAAAA